ncbi:MAG: aminopeptidase [Xanthomonadales bacterium]|nr:aminopeptidase [Xanthomonadales bacterium]
MRFITLLLTSLILISCSQDEDVAIQKEVVDLGHDYFSFANSDQFDTSHIALDLTVDFELKELRGSVTLNMRRLDPEATDIILDTRDLHIDGVLVAGIEAVFAYSEQDPVLGQALKITLPAGLEQQSDLVVTIHYKTDPGASALQWLPPELTAGGKHPYMFSQSQSIHARSWVPLQDTPSVRITYEANIHTPANLLAVMSADNDPLTPRSGEYHFNMPQPIPAYLLAIAVGNIYFAPIGELTGIYTEPEMLDASTFEFASTQQMLDTASEIYGPYQWGRYDLLILPPSFPFGGMENPRLSFITPSVLAGDQSLVSLIAHELAHSWSGNMVSNKTWRDIWLNEGITSYLDSRLMEVLFGEDKANEERVISYRDLLQGLTEVKPPYQALAPTERLSDPDESQGSMHYKKGQLFLETMEEAFGRDVFDPFLNGYFNHFAFQSISTEQFLDYLDENLLSAQPGKFSREQAEEWIYQAGVPDNARIPHSETLDQAERLASSWAVGEVSVEHIPMSDWSPHAAVHFINNLPVNLTETQLGELDSSFGFSATRNAEISRAWFIQVANRRYLPAYKAMEAHLNHYGRTRLIKPVYVALVKNGEDSELAHQLFDEAKSSYHPLTITGIETAFRKAEQGL